MPRLLLLADSVAERSTTVSTKLQARQDKMEELHAVQQLLRKLQAVFDLPKRMRAALEEDVLDTAVSFYAEAQPLLKKYGGRGTFRQIALESDQVAKEVSQVGGRETEGDRGCTRRASAAPRHVSMAHAAPHAWAHHAAWPRRILRYC